MEEEETQGLDLRGGNAEEIKKRNPQSLALTLPPLADQGAGTFVAVHCPPLRHLCSTPQHPILAAPLHPSDTEHSLDENLAEEYRTSELASLQEPQSGHLPFCPVPKRDKGWEETQFGAFWN
jgi:hypothetical protein